MRSKGSSSCLFPTYLLSCSLCLSCGEPPESPLPTFEAEPGDPVVYLDFSLPHARNEVPDSPIAFEPPTLVPVAVRLKVVGAEAPACREGVGEKLFVLAGSQRMRVCDGNWSGFAEAGERTIDVELVGKGTKSLVLAASVDLAAGGTNNVIEVDVVRLRLEGGNTAMKRVRADATRPDGWVLGIAEIDLLAPAQAPYELWAPAGAVISVLAERRTL